MCRQVLDAPPLRCLQSKTNKPLHARDCNGCALTHLCLPTLQVGEIEEQLTSARRELARSEEANQKLQRDVKEVRLAKTVDGQQAGVPVAVESKSSLLLRLTKNI